MASEIRVNTENSRKGYRKKDYIKERRYNIKKDSKRIKDKRKGKMKKIIIIAVVLLLVLTGIGAVHHFTDERGNSRITNDMAESDKQGRYLTIINHTDQIINEVHITVGEGTEIEHGYQENPDEESFSVEIPEEYKEYSTFTVTFVDRYGMKYQKKITDVSERGRTEVEITEEDGDLTRKIDRFFNGD